MSTPLRNVRVSDALWNDARKVAEARGESISSIIVAALAEYVRTNQPKQATKAGRK
jgi:predicted transcriptional regulator